jgi:hypothetical protein
MITKEELATEVLAVRSSYSQQDWLDLLDNRGTGKKFDSQLEWLSKNLPRVDRPHSHSASGVYE